MRGQVLVNEERCKACSLCITACPHGVLQLSTKINSKGYHPVEVYQPDKCTGCTLCGVICPDLVLTIKRESPERK
ncbi:MAG: 4Fe-4S binding protein [Firmicutes bacterium]|nr:4Fe-4S binding protein [Bacillota bacterium]